MFWNRSRPTTRLHVSQALLNSQEWAACTTTKKTLSERTPETQRIMLKISFQLSRCLKCSHSTLNSARNDQSYRCLTSFLSRLKGWSTTTELNSTTMESFPECCTQPKTSVSFPISSSRATTRESSQLWTIADALLIYNCSLMTSKKSSSVLINSMTSVLLTNISTN